MLFKLIYFLKFIKYSTALLIFNLMLAMAGVNTFDEQPQAKG